MKSSLTLSTPAGQTTALRWPKLALIICLTALIGLSTLLALSRPAFAHPPASPSEPTVGGLQITLAQTDTVDPAQPEPEQPPAEQPPAEQPPVEQPPADDGSGLVFNQVEFIDTLVQGFAWLWLCVGGVIIVLALLFFPIIWWRGVILRRRQEAVIEVDEIQ